MKALNEFLRPEFISRVDEIVVFQPLSIESYQKIAKLMLDEMRAPLAEKDIGLEISDEVYVYIAKKAFNGKYGGRDIRRVIRKELEDKVANLIIEKGESGISTILISIQDEQIAVNYK
jgi:ATP-dependent Clp protease ATP-binding subunit ClpA